MTTTQFIDHKPPHTDADDHTYPAQPLRPFDLRTAPEIVHADLATLRADLDTLRTDILIMRDERMEINQRLACLETYMQRLLNPGEEEEPDT